VAEIAELAVATAGHEDLWASMQGEKSLGQMTLTLFAH